MNASIMPLSAIPGRMIEDAAVSISKLSHESFRRSARIDGDSI